MQSSAMAATKRSSPLRGSVCLQVSNYKVSPSSQPLPIGVSYLVVLTLAYVSRVEKPGISVHVAP